ncbi:MAG: N4-gp56 family major capsid protein [Candidatus Atribacteria bacterium]|nr:MAG: N4-gp56 family major capsid protein [Candidatus Atribacteria bacterium]
MAFTVYTNTNKKADAAELVNIFYDKTALKEGKPFNRLEQFAVKSRNIPQGAGDEIDWWKTVPIDVASDYSVLTEGESPAATKLNWQRVKALVKGYGLVISLSEFLQIISIDPKMQSTAGSLGIHREKTINRMYWGCLVQNLYPMRMDGSSTYEKLFTSATSTSSSVLVSANLSGADDKWLGGVVAITSGNNFGMGGYISDSDQGDTSITLSSTAPSYILNETPGDGDLGKVATTTGLDSDNPLECAGVAKSVVILQTNLTTPYEDGYFVGILSPFTQFDVRNDSEWVNADHYAGSKKLYNGEVGEWGGIRFVLDSLPWRSDAGVMGTYAAAGAIFHTPIFGKECYAGVRFNGVQDKLIKKSKEQTGDPLETYSTLGWKAYLVPKVLHSVFGVQILSGATSII